MKPSRSKDEVQEDIDASKARAKELEGELSDLQADQHHLEEELEKSKEKAKEVSEKLEEEAARLVGLENEMQGAE